MKEKITIIRKLLKKLSINKQVLTFSIIGNSYVELYVKASNLDLIHDILVDSGVYCSDYDPNVIPDFLGRREALCKAADRLSRLYLFFQSKDLKETVLRGVTGELLELTLDRIEESTDLKREKNERAKRLEAQQKTKMYGDDAHKHFQSNWFDFRTRIGKMGIQVNETLMTSAVRSEIRAKWAKSFEFNLDKEFQTRLMNGILRQYCSFFTGSGLEELNFDSEMAADDEGDALPTQW